MSALHGQPAAGGWGRRQQTVDVSDLTPEKFAQTLMDTRKHHEAIKFLRDSLKFVEKNLAETSARNASVNRFSPAQKLSLASEIAEENGTNESWWENKPGNFLMRTRLCHVACAGALTMRVSAQGPPSRSGCARSRPSSSSST